MMRYLLFLLIILSCTTQEDVPIDTQEYIFTYRNGQSFMRVLPAGWEPNYEGSFLRIDPRHRVLAQDILMIEPRVPLNVENMRMVKLMRREPPGRRATYQLWVPAGSEEILRDDPPNELVKIAPHTWIRPNEFNVQFDRE